MSLRWRSRHSTSPNSWKGKTLHHISRTYEPNGVLFKQSDEMLGSAGEYPPSTTDQNTGSEPHPRNRDGSYRSGGPFYTSKLSTSCPVGGGYSWHHVEPGNFGRTIHHYLNGGKTIYPPEAIEAFRGATLSPRSKTLSDLDPLGTTAISACSPANPASELGTGVSELYREGLPSLPGIHTWRDRTGIAKSAGSEYLNKEFGWDPLVGEVKNFSSVVRRHRDILNQYSRNAGSTVRRRFNFPLLSERDEKVVSEHRCTCTGFSATYQVTNGPVKAILTSGSEIRRWFAGAFTYAVPDQDDTWKRALGYGTSADVLFGASLNPSLLWNLTPWSWAVDWFSNTGDIINNVSNYVRAGQVMQYGYMMEEHVSFIELSMNSSGYEGLATPPPFRKECVTKVRQPATPYGFGIDLSSLSPTQIAISVALGITLL